MAKKLHIKKKWFRIIPFIALFVIYLCSELYFIKNYVTKGGKSSREIYDNPDETINIYDLRYTKRMVSDKSKAEKKDDLYEYYSISFKLCTESNNPPEIKKEDIQLEYQVNGEWYLCPYHSEKPLFFKSDSLEENIVWEKNPNGSVLTYEILIYPFTQNFFGLWKRNRFWEGNYRLLIKLDNGKYIEKTFMIPPCS